jgi:molybdopterin biosynthesis enzyme
MPPAHAPLARATLATDVVGDKERFLVLPVRLDHGTAHPTLKSSGALTSLASSDGWIGVPEGARLAAGAVVDVHLW